MATALKLQANAPEGFDDSSVEDLIAKVRALRPFLQEHAAAGEAQRSPVAEVDKALRDIGAFTLLLPRRWGGSGLSATGFARVQMEVAKGDPSIAWVLQIINGTTWIASLTSDALQEALFEKGTVLVCGAYNPPGKARKVEGGYMVSGKWPYSSGSRQADWAQCGCIFIDTDGPIVPGINMAYIPMSQITIEDSWYITGMQGTGSDTTVANDVFVPDHLMVTMDKPFGHVEPGKRHWGAPSDALPVVPTVRATGLAQLLGAAQAMLEIVEAESVKKPIVTTTFKSRAESHVAVHDLGKVAAQLDAARLLLLDATGQLDAKAQASQTWTDLERSAHKAQCAQVAELIHTSIEKLMFISGSSAFMLSNPLQRYWRDIHVGLRHIANIPQLGYELYGRDRLGVTPNISPSGAY